MLQVLIKMSDDWAEVYVDGKKVYEGHGGWLSALANKWEGGKLMEALGAEVELIETEF
jgi:hypothetical protein